jgi:dephospho-CoA kinase
MTPGNLLDYLFIIGKPASGKSTVSRIVLEMLDLPDSNAIFGLGKMRRAAVLEVTAPDSVIRQRNQNRPLADQVPEEYLQMVLAPSASKWRERISVGRYATLLNDSTLSTSELEARVKSALHELELFFLK